MIGNYTKAEKWHYFGSHSKQEHWMFVFPKPQEEWLYEHNDVSFEE